MLDLLSTGVDSWNDGSAGGNGRDGVVSALTFRVSREMMSRQCLYSLNLTMILNFFLSFVVCLLQGMCLSNPSASHLALTNLWTMEKHLHRSFSSILRPLSSAL